MKQTQSLSHNLVRKTLQTIITLQINHSGGTGTKEYHTLGVIAGDLRKRKGWEKGFFEDAEAEIRAGE